MPGTQALIITTISGTLMVGMILSLLGALRTPLARHLGREEGQAGGLRLVFLVAMIAALVLSGLLVDLWGTREGLILGSLATAVGLASLGLSRAYPQGLGAAAILGGGLALAHTATATLLPTALEAPDEPTRATNLGYLFVGVSTLLMAGLLPVLERKLGLRQSLLILALVCLLPAVAAGFTPGPAFPQTSQGSATAVLADPRLWLAALVLFLYYPLEMVLTAWAPAYLTEVGRAPGSIPFILLGYWIAFLVARFLTAFALPGFVPWLILLLILLAAATVGNLSGIYRATGGTLGLWVLGACLGPVFPSLVGLVLQMFPSHPALAFGAVVAVGSSSTLVLPPLFESFARGHSVRLSMRLVMLAALVLAAPTLVLCLVVRE
jgi:fucose permease